MSAAAEGPATTGARVAVVIAGAGARGAYEAGVLSVLLPRLAKEGVRPDLYVGTSAGAINATVLAANAHLPAAEQVEALLATWRSITSSDVYRSLLRTAPLTCLRWSGQLLGVPGTRLLGLLDTAPLWRTADRLLDWDRLRANLDNGACALAVVTTEAASNRTVVFVDRCEGEVPASDDGRPIDYVGTAVTAEHVLASAAIPVAFPAVRVDRPQDAAGWYLDGGVRLNAPLKPALALGARALVVVATHPATYPGPSAPAGPFTGPPDVDDMVVRLMDAALVDRMVEDLHTLARTNELLEAGAQRRTGDRELAVVPFVFVGPAERASLARVAARCFDERYAGPGGRWRSLREIDLRLLGRFLGGDGDRRGDLLSFLLFQREFTEAAIELGRSDAAGVAGPTSSPVAWTTAAAEVPVG